MLDETVKRIAKPDRVHSWVIDIADLAAVEAATKATFDHFGKIDILVDNAAIIQPNAPTWEYPPEAFRDVVNVGLIGTFYCCRGRPHMIAANYGRIVDALRSPAKRQSESTGLQLDEGGRDRADKSLGKELATSTSRSIA